MTRRSELAGPSERRLDTVIILLWISFAVSLPMLVWWQGVPTSIELSLGIGILLAAAVLMGSVMTSAGGVSVHYLVLLCAGALTSPGGAGLVGVALALLMRERMTMRSRLANVAMVGLTGVASGVAFEMAGGHRAGQRLNGAASLLSTVGLPLLAAVLFQALVNGFIMASFFWAAYGAGLRGTMTRLFTGTGPAMVGYGVLALIVVTLWRGGLGWLSAPVVIPALTAAWWAFRQFGEEEEAHARSLDVLVAVVEAKAPHLEQHSHRVAALAGATAEALGLSPQDVSSIRMAGMLHDVGQVALPRDVVDLRGESADDSTFATYPRLGVDILRGLTFLSGSLDGIALHRAVPPARVIELESAPWTSGQIVHLADTYDLLTEGRGSDGVHHPQAAVLAALRGAGDPARGRLVDALETALSRERAAS